MFIGSFPYFFLALLAVYVFGVKTGWFPQGYAYEFGLTEGWNLPSCAMSPGIWCCR